MSESYYRQNQDQLSGGSNYCSPRNCVLEAIKSDISYSNGGGGSEGLSTFTLYATGGEYTIQDDRVIDATIVGLWRDGIKYEETNQPFTGTRKEFQFSPSTGEIIFPPAPFPPLQPDESVSPLYETSTGDVIITEPVTLQQAKDWLRVTHDEEDDLIAALITAAREYCESYTGLSFVERTVTAVVKNELGNIRLPYGPVQNVIGCQDISGNEVDSSGVAGESFKRLRYPVSPYVSVSYTAGFAVLPQQFKTALKMQLSWMYVHRGDETFTSELAPDAKLILSKHRAIV